MVGEVVVAAPRQGVTATTLKGLQRSAYYSMLNISTLKSSLLAVGSMTKPVISGR